MKIVTLIPPKVYNTHMEYVDVEAFLVLDTGEEYKRTWHYNLFTFEFWDGDITYSPDSESDFDEPDKPVPDIVTKEFQRLRDWGFEAAASVNRD